MEQNLEAQEIDKVDPAVAAGTDAEAEPRADAPEGIDEQTEVRARAMGWKPQDEYRGDPKQWKDANTFVQAAEHNLPMMRERLDTVARRNTELERELQTTRSTHQDQFKRLERMSQVALDRQRAQIVGSYEAAMRTAAETGDVTRYDQLHQARGEAVKAFDQAAWEATKAPEPQQHQQTPQLPPDQQNAVAQWQTANPWYGRDEGMTMLAGMESARIARDHPGLTVQQNLAEVRRVIAQRFPEKFGTSHQATPRNGSASVESGSRMPSGSGGRKGWGDLPSDAKAAGQNFIKQGLFKDQAEYASEYWSQA